MRTDKELEAIARRYCAELSLDPDEVVTLGAVPHWQRVALEIKPQVVLFDILQTGST